MRNVPKLLLLCCVPWFQALYCERCGLSSNVTRFGPAAAAGRRSSDGRRQTSRRPAVQLSDTAVAGGQQ